jgi:excisionase family DNA binding protein
LCGGVGDTVDMDFLRHPVQDGSDEPERDYDDRFLRETQLEARRIIDEIGSPYATLDITFLAYLLRTSQFGFFTFGPVTIDTRMIEDIVRRTSPRGAMGPSVYDDSFVRFSRTLMDEVRRSGRSRIDELHYLLAFMRTPEGLPQRVFSELGVTPEQVEQYVRNRRAGAAEPEMEQLFSPEETADYLGVHVQTVRAWIRSGRLPASRLAGQRALRIRASDLKRVLEPIKPGEDL